MENYNLFFLHSQNKYVSLVVFSSYVASIEFWAEQNSDDLTFTNQYRLLWGKLEIINAKALYEREIMGSHQFFYGKIWEKKYMERAKIAIDNLVSFVSQNRYL
ncbi:MAG: hypothetical protein IJL60_01405 [Clostridiales bacterium]|nr:hypothetical protein [Clostridiales bacterium]